MPRINFATELENAERGLLSEAGLVRQQLDRVTEALATRSVELAETVIAQDDPVDGLYLATDTRVLNLIALQAPVAGDLRLVSAILHSNLHLERIGDLCVNIAKFVMNEHPYPTATPMVRTLREMGDRAGEMLDIGVKAFSERDADLAEELPVKDDTLDLLNRAMLEHLREYMSDPESFEWASHLLLVARYLERIGDHTVDIGEQVSYLVTGVFREFTDASHPDGLSGSPGSDMTPDSK
jgi:phosphate transport system protein